MPFDMVSGRKWRPSAQRSGPTNTPFRPPCWTMRHRITSFRCV